MGKQQDWKKVLKADPTNLLLQEAGNLDKYYILREIMGKPEEDTEVSNLKNALVDDILSKQMENGSWNGKAYDYQEGTTHQLMKLIELGLSAQDAPVKKGTEFLLQCQAENGSFIQGEIKCVCATDADPVVNAFPVINTNPVVTNAVLLALVRTGYSDDPRVTKGYEWLCSWQDKDGSWLSPRAKRSREQGEGYPHPYCGIHATCNALLGLSATEKYRQSQAAKRGAEFILNSYGNKYDRSVESPYAVTSTPFDGAWFDPRCVAPADTNPPDSVVEVISTQHVLATLSMLGYGLENERVRAGVQRLIGFQSQDGLWLMDHQFTLHTLMAIKSFHQPLCFFSFHGH